MPQDAVNRLADVATLERLADLAAVGRRFTADRKVRLGDADRSGRLRLDALTRYTQDVSDDDTTDAGLAAEPGWVVRSTVVDELAPAVLGETLSFITFCSALGSRWAERRLSITGSLGARYEVATLWVCVDHQTNKPATLTEQFRALYGEAAAGRTVKARLVNPKPSAVDGRNGVEPAETESWPLRVVDFDVYDHVNNAAYWSAVEQWVPARTTGGGFQPRRVRMEYGKGVGPTVSVKVARAEADDGVVLWWLDQDVDAPTLASAVVTAIPIGLY